MVIGLVILNGEGNYSLLVSYVHEWEVTEL